MFWDTHDEADPRIARRYGWMEISGLSRSGTVAARVEGDESGVYIVADAVYRVSYVGHAEPGRLRTEVLWALRRRKAREGMQVLWLVTGSVDEAKALKRYLLRKYQPPQNQAVKTGRRPTSTLSYRDGQPDRRRRVLGDTTSQVPIQQAPSQPAQPAQPAQPQPAQQPASTAEPERWQPSAPRADMLPTEPPPGSPRRRRTGQIIVPLSNPTPTPA